MNNSRHIECPVALRELIDSALHETMQQFFFTKELSSGTFGRCADYAIVGSRVLREITGQDFQIVAGGEVIDCGHGKYLILFPDRKSRRNAKSLAELKEYHCWIKLDHKFDGGVFRKEIIDFTVRHDSDVAHIMNIDFHRDASSDFIWTFEDLLGEPPQPVCKITNFKNWFWEDKKCTDLLLKYEKQHKSIFEKISHLVLIAVGNNLEKINIST